jgi:hypothetical protein
VLASDTAFDGYRTAQKEASHALLKQLPATDDGLVVAVAGTLNTDQRRALAAAEPEWNPVLNRSGARLLDVWQGLSAELRVDTRPEFQLSVFAAADSNRATLRATAEAVAAKLKQLLPGGGESFFAAAEMRLQGESDPPAGSWRLDTNALQKFISQSMAGLDPWLAARLSDGDLSRLREVALAVHNYASAYGHLPAVDLKPNGEPSGLSWRVRLLPFLGEQELWRRFRLDEPWDSAHNRALIAEMPPVFRSFRSELHQSEGRANVVAPAGPDTFWVPGRQLQFRDITDGTSNTILLMQVDDALAPIWTQPEPFEVTAENVLERARGFEAGRLPLALGDGWVGVLKTPATAAKLFGFFTRAGGEVTRFEFEQ